MSAQQQYYVFVEHNENEGETWCFYVPMTQQEADHLADVLDAATELEDKYSFSGPIMEEHIDTLLKYGNEGSGYFKAHTKCSGTMLDIMSLEIDIDADELDDHFYKGNCWKMIA